MKLSCEIVAAIVQHFLNLGSRTIPFVSLLTKRDKSFHAVFEMEILQVSNSLLSGGQKHFFTVSSYFPSELSICLSKI